MIQNEQTNSNSLTNVNQTQTHTNNTLLNKNENINKLHLFKNYSKSNESVILVKYNVLDINDGSVIEFYSCGVLVSSRVVLVPFDLSLNNQERYSILRILILTKFSTVDGEKNKFQKLANSFLPEQVPVVDYIIYNNNNPEINMDMNNQNNQKSSSTKKISCWGLLLSDLPLISLLNKPKMNIISNKFIKSNMNIHSNSNSLSNLNSDSEAEDDNLTEIFINFKNLQEKEREKAVFKFLEFEISLEKSHHISNNNSIYKQENDEMSKNFNIAYKPIFRLNNYNVDIDNDVFFLNNPDFYNSTPGIITCLINKKEYIVGISSNTIITIENDNKPKNTNDNENNKEIEPEEFKLAEKFSAATIITIRDRINYWEGKTDDINKKIDFNFVEYLNKKISSIDDFKILVKNNAEKLTSVINDFNQITGRLPDPKRLNLSLISEQFQNKSEKACRYRK